MEHEAEILSNDSNLATKLRTIPGFGIICAAELAGEIGIMNRFNSESSLALYLGMAVLDNNSGNYRGTKCSKYVNNIGKAAMMAATAKHIHCVKEAKYYYDKKRNEGKKHNQSVRSLGRQLIKVMWSMIKNYREYKIKEE